MLQLLTSVLDVVRTISICPPQRLINLRKNLLAASPLPGASCRYLVLTILDNVLFRALCNVLISYTFLYDADLMPTGASVNLARVDYIIPPLTICVNRLPWGSIFLTKAISMAQLLADKLPYRQNQGRMAEVCKLTFWCCRWTPWAKWRRLCRSEDLRTYVSVHYPWTLLRLTYLKFLSSSFDTFLPASLL